MSLKPQFSDEEIATAIGVPLEHWARRCHEISLAIVKAEIFPQRGRIARGRCRGIVSQHSWIVLGSNCYAEDAVIVDPTLWTYDKTVEGIWYGSAADGRHVPHGAGSIWDYGRPSFPTDEVLHLKVPLSEEAQLFFRLIGDLDYRGWCDLASSPVEGWPAAEIIMAMERSGLSSCIPIDTLGMLTDINPNGLYLPGDEVEVSR